MLVPMIDLLKHADAEKYAVGSFDVHNLEMAIGVLEAAQKHDSPVIVAIPEANFKIQQFEVFVNAIRELAEPLDIPVALLLDHGRSYESCVRAIKAGMTTVMYDGSDLPFEENVATTEALVKVAKPLGITVEAEVGHVAKPGLSADEIAKMVTQPSKAVEFVERTGVDCLAVAIGTIHGKYKGEPRIRFDLLEEIRGLVQIPLVLHGGSSTGVENIQRAIQSGISKVNIYTDMADAARDNIFKTLQKDPSTRINDLLIATKESFAEVSGYYMQMFGSAGQAKRVPRKERLLQLGDMETQKQLTHIE